MGSSARSERAALPIILRSRPEQNTMNIHMAQNTHPLPKSSLATISMNGEAYRAADRTPFIPDRELLCFERYEAITIMNVIFTISEG